MLWILSCSTHPKQPERSSLSDTSSRPEPLEYCGRRNSAAVKSASCCPVSQECDVWSTRGPRSQRVSIRLCKRVFVEEIGT